MRAIANNNNSEKNNSEKTDSEKKNKKGAKNDKKIVISPPAGNTVMKPFPLNSPKLVVEGVEWVQLMDSDNNKFYWYCDEINKTQWSNPKNQSPSSASNKDDDDSENTNESGKNPVSRIFIIYYFIWNFKIFSSSCCYCVLWCM